MWWFREILSCFKFLLITSDSKLFYTKRVYEFFAPLIVSIIFITIYYFSDNIYLIKSIKILSENIFNFMIFLVPFHLVSLGAFSTVNSNILDERLKGANAQIKTWSNKDNDHYYKILTLRQYVSYIFGYLCSIGIIFILFYLIITMINVNYYNNDFSCSLLFLLLGFEVFFIFHYVFLTLYAITFLFDKVNDARS